MKKFISISLSIFFLFIGLLLTSCGDGTTTTQTSIYQSDNITTDLKLVKATGKSLTFDITINDTKSEITKNSVQVIVYDDDNVVIVCNSLDKSLKRKNEHQLNMVFDYDSYGAA